MSRRHTCTGVLFWILIVATACSSSESPGRTGSVVVVELADMEKPMPLISESSLDNELQGIMYRSLLSAAWIDGELVYQTAEESPMALARAWEYAGEDSSAIRYHLVADAVWSDGMPVTAHDAKWTLETQGDPRTASPRQDYNRQIDEVVAENDTTLLVQFHRAYPEMLFHSAGSVAPRHLYEETSPDQLRSHPALLDPAEHLVVSGPYRIANWRRGERVILEPNPRFHPRPKIGRLIFRIIPEQTTRLIEFQTGNVDMVSLPFDRVEEIEQAPHLRIETREKRFYDYVSYNPRAHDFLAEPEIRRALGLAIDHEGLLASLSMERYAVPAGGPYPPIFRDLYDPEAHAPLPYDPDQAREILDSHGWMPGGDGIRTRDGERLAFTLATNAGNQRRADIAEMVQQQWRQIGMDVDIRIVESNTFFEQLTQRDFEAAIAGWGVGLSPDIQSVWGDPALPFNYVSYDNPQARELMEQALSQRTEEEAADYWRQAASLIIEDQPYTWLYYFDGLVGVNNRLRGTTINTLGTYQRIWEWELAQ
ncbi:MAG: ABC transporter substrate-binding protein [Balneolaceae bacterium]